MTKGSMRSIFKGFAAGLLAMALGCNGSIVAPVPVKPISSSTPGPDTFFEVDCSTVPDPVIVHATLRKLGNVELTNSLQDLLGLSSTVVADLPPDTASPEGFNNNGDFLGTNAEFAGKALVVVENALTKAASEKSSSFKCPSGAEDTACAQTLIKALLRKAYRAPISTDELNSHVSLFESQRTAGDTFADALSTVYARALMSPRFLFRTATNGDAVSGDVVRLSSHELATRLAYFLWSSAPDEQLLDRAEGDMFQNDATLRAEIVRMLADARGRRFVDTFVGQWLGIDRIASTVLVRRDGLMDDMRQDMIDETKTFADYIFRKDQSVLDLVGADYTFMNQRLAEHYGIADVSGTDMSKVSLASTLRRGFITQASFLTLNAKPGGSAPVGRGNKILKVVTCTPPATPDFTEEIAEQFAATEDPNATIREHMVAHRAKPECAGCHTEMDPIGLGLENFDQIGRHRDVYPNGRSIDLTGSLRGTPFKDTSELIAIINAQTNYKRCITKNLVTYAIGRTALATPNEQCAFQKIGELAVQKNKTFVDLVAAIVKSDLFKLNTLND